MTIKTSFPYTILVTGAGGAVFPVLIESLRIKGFRIIATDIDPNAIGLYLADKGYIIPKGLSPDFLPVMREICKRENVKAVVPLVDEELVRALELEYDGIAVILPKREFVETCLDKYLLMNKLNTAGINSPKTCLFTDEHTNIGFPLVVKPRRGRGSRGVGIIKSEHELTSFLKHVQYAPDELILQEYINGPEYTVSVVVWRDGKVQAVVPKEIISKKGITRIAVTRKNSKIESVCYSIQEKLKADGPFNVQLRIDAVIGMPSIFEINPRFSTSISLTMASGIDELGGLISQALLGRESVKFGTWREGIVLLRKSVDHFMDESDFYSIRESIVDREK